MMGSNIDDEDGKGIIPRMVKSIFEQIAQTPEDIKATVKVSFIEIYNEKIRDLLNTDQTDLKIHENKEKGVYLKNMTES